MTRDSTAHLVTMLPRKELVTGLLLPSFTLKKAQGRGFKLPLTAWAGLSFLASDLTSFSVCPVRCPKFTMVKSKSCSQTR